MGLPIYKKLMKNENNLSIFLIWSIFLKIVDLQKDLCVLRLSYFKLAIL